MIERTVSSLEPCKIRGIVRKAASQAPKQRQRLRTGFWQHGALAIELSHGWPAVLEKRKQRRSKPSRTSGSESKPLESELLASAFRLDFLYPNLNIDCLRPGPTNPRRDIRNGKEKRRKYGTSSDAPAEAHEPAASVPESQWEPRSTSPIARKNDHASPEGPGRPRPKFNAGSARHVSSLENELNSPLSKSGEPDIGANRPTNTAQRNPPGSEASPNLPQDTSLRYRTLGPDPDQSVRSDEIRAGHAELATDTSAGSVNEQAGVRAAPEATTSLDETRISPLNGSEATQVTLKQGATSPKHLDSLLNSLASDAQASQHLDVYDLYARLDPNDRIRYRPRVVVYLSRSYNVVAYNRSLSLFRQIDEELWTDDLLAAGISLLLRSSQSSLAVNAFKRGAQKKALTGGVDLLLANLFRSRSWSGVLSIWKIWYDIRVQQGETSRAAKEILSKLAGLDQALPGLYFSFEQYLASGRVKDVEAGSLTPIEPAIDLLRRRFGKMALDRSSPSRAEVILSFYQSRKLYHRYLETMSMKWVRREITKETAAGLSSVYESYRRHGNFQPSETILHGMFEVYYPTHLQALNRLQDDWCRAHGELSESGFHKYFKLHARLGNVAATQDLIQRYYRKFPSKDRGEGALRLMRVYARQGNPAAVQRIQDSLPTSKGHRAQSQEIYRTKLLAHVKADQHSEAITCFNKMAQLGFLESADYAQMMHMCSKHGDLDETLRYFSLAQENKVVIKPGMVAAAVLAFISNDRLQDAESVAVVMADRGVTSTDIWNELIKANGIVGNMPRCYGLLAVMEKRKIEFSADTYEITLTAMVRYGQIGAAISMLKDPRTRKTFTPSAEHYAVVMAGAVRVGDFNAVQMLAREMQSLPGNASFASRVSLLAAAVHSGEIAQQTRALGLELVKVMRTLQERKMATTTLQSPEEAVTSVHRDDQSSAAATKSLDPSTVFRFDEELQNMNSAALTKTTKPIGLAVALLVQLRQQFAAEELVNMYLQLQPRKAGEPLPSTLISSLMRAHHNDGDYERVLEIWEKYWPRAVEFWVRQESGLAKPNKQYALMHVLDLVTLSYRALGDGGGLSKFVMNVYVAGFKMSSNNWNRVVRALAELGDFKVAAKWCEIILMPYWRGWQRLPGHKVNTPERNRFERAIKRAQLDHHFMRPHQETILALRDQYRRIRADAMWSYDKAKLAVALEEENPRLFQAFAVAPLGFEGKAANRVSVGGIALEQHLNRFIETLSATEAKEMNKALSRLLHNRKDPIAIQDVENLVKGFASTGQSPSTDARSKVMKALAQQTDFSGTSSLPKRRETQPTDLVELRKLEAKTNEMLEADRAKGDRIIQKRMSNWMARTWKRGKFSRWDDQWAGWGDKTNAPL